MLFCALAKAMQTTIAVIRDSDSEWCDNVLLIEKFGLDTSV